MKPKDIFNLVVRLLGLLFLYHAFINLPTALSGALYSWVFVLCFMAVAWWLLNTRWLTSRAYPENSLEQQKTGEVAAGFKQKGEA